MPSHFTRSVWLTAARLVPLHAVHTRKVALRCIDPRGRIQPPAFVRSSLPDPPQAMHLIAQPLVHHAPRELLEQRRRR
jgi:hypothetical protein